jgi:hypothetical protein
VSGISLVLVSALKAFFSSHLLFLLIAALLLNKTVSMDPMNLDISPIGTFSPALPVLLRVALEVASINPQAQQTVLGELGPVQDTSVPTTATIPTNAPWCEGYVEGSVAKIKVDYIIFFHVFSLSSCSFGSQGPSKDRWFRNTSKNCLRKVHLNIDETEGLAVLVTGPDAALLTVAAYNLKSDSLLSRHSMITNMAASLKYSEPFLRRLAVRSGRGGCKSELQKLIDSAIDKLNPQLHLLAATCERHSLLQPISLLALIDVEENCSIVFDEFASGSYNKFLQIGAESSWPWVPMHTFVSAASAFFGRDGTQSHVESSAQSKQQAAIFQVSLVAKIAGILKGIVSQGASNYLTMLIFLFNTPPSRSASALGACFECKNFCLLGSTFRPSCQQ